MLRLVALLVLGCSFPALAQTAMTSYAERRTSLQQRGTRAVQSETSRVASQPCSQPENTASTSACLRAEGSKAQESYSVFRASVDGLLQLLPPDATQPERADAREVRKTFRLAESRWLLYRNAQCEAVQLMSCEPDLTHRHIEELSILYDRLFH